MTQSQNSVFTAALICAATASVIAGIAMRDNIDVGGATRLSAERVVGSGLMASRSNETQIPEAKYFSEMAQLLKQKYVEPINDDMKLAVGAVRGMVGSLNDTQSLFYTPEMAKAYQSALLGDYEGIGADLELSRPAKQPEGSTTTEGSPDDPLAGSLPKLVANGIVPGGPAEKAGVKPGDWVESVNGHWVYNANAIDELRAAQAKVNAKEWPSSKLHDLSNQLRAKVNGAIMPYKALDRLSTGAEGTVTVVWNRPGAGQVTTAIAKGHASVPAVVELAPGTFRLRLVSGVAEKLTKAVFGRTEVTLDLRSESYGDFTVLSDALGAIGPPGSYGSLAREGGKDSLEVRARGGQASPPKLKILVDGRTGGLYQAFALALSSKAGAAVVGTGPSPKVSMYRALPDGSAYTLVAGVFKPAATGGKR